MINLLLLWLLMRFVGFFINFFKVFDFFFVCCRDHLRKTFSMRLLIELNVVEFVQMLKLKNSGYFCRMLMKFIVNIVFFFKLFVCVCENVNVCFSHQCRYRRSFLKPFFELNDVRWNFKGSFCLSLCDN